MPNRRISVGITLIAIIFGALSLIPLSQLHFEHDYKAWLSPSHPSYAIYQSFTEEYGGDNALLFHLDSDQIFFSVDSINRFLDIVKAINQDASISESTDPINYLATRHDMALITKRNFVRFKSLWDSLAKESSVMQNFLISDDSHYMGLVTYFKPDIDSGQQHSFLTHTQSALEQAGFDTHIAGPAYFGQELQNAFKKDLPMIIALLALISIICMAVIFKDFRLVIAVFICLAISLEFAMALFYLAGKQISLLSLLMIPLMYCIGLTNAIHLYHRLGSNREHDSIPFKARYYSVFVPSCLAVLTTAIGTMAFLFSDQPAIQPMGWIAPSAAIMSFGMIFIFSPCIYHAIGGDFNYFIKSPMYLDTAQKSKRFFILGSTLILGTFIAAYFSFQIKMSSDAMDFFNQRSNLKQAYQHINNTLTGTYAIDMVFNSNAGEQVIDPEYIRRLAIFEAEIGQVHGYRASTSIVNIIREGFRRNKINKSVLDASDSLIHKAINRIESKAPSVYGRFIAGNGQSARMAIRFSHNDIVGIDIPNLISQSWSKVDRDIHSIQVTGIVPLILEGQSALLSSQLKAYSLIAMIILIIFGFIFRSAKLVFYAVLVNGLPGIYMLGLMGVLGIPFNMVNVFVLSVMLGVIVDDSIHLLLAYKESGSINLALKKTGQPILLTSITIILSFSALLISSIEPIKQFAILAIGAVVIAYLCDRYLLPLMIIMFNREEI